MENNLKLYDAFKEMEQIILKTDIAIGEKKIKLNDLLIEKAIRDLEEFKIKHK